MNSWQAFSASCRLWKDFPWKKIVKMLEEVVVGWQEVGWIWRRRRNFVAQFAQLLKYRCAVRRYHREELGPFCWTMRLQALQFSVYLIDLLRIFLRCNGFTAGIQKAIVDQMGSRTLNSDHDSFFGVSLTLGSALELLLGPATELVVTSHHIKFTFHRMSQFNLEMVHCCVE